ncbi:MAG: M55 family metallopeptidase [Bacillota bacterium]|nr:M55 family metallopeptidase [Bacillota bacterium]
MAQTAKRVFISCDIEGITGVVGREQAGQTGKDYERARRLMTGDVNAAIAGALAAGAERIVVSDGHGNMQNVILEELDPAAELVSGSPKPLTQVEGIDEGFDVAFFVGYHARMGSTGVLSHTISGSTVANIWVNEVLMGETGINAVLAGHFGVPVGLVSGDQCVCAEARELLPAVKTAVVKHAITRYSARCMHPERSRELIRGAAEAAMRDVETMAPYQVVTPVTFAIQFKDTGMAEAAVRMAGVKVINPSTLSFTHDSPVVGFKTLRGMIGLAAG